MKNTAREQQTKVIALGKLICGLLQNQGMTTRELVNCLMSESYNIPHSDLRFISIALNSIDDSDLLRVRFRSNDTNLNIEPIFRVIALRK